MHTYTGSGNYTITLTINNSACSSSQTFSILISTTKIEDQNAHVQIIPNPSDGLTKIALNNAIDFDLAITIHDITGKVIKQSTIQKGDTHIEMDLSGFPAAVYSVQINGNGFMSTKKLILY